MAKRKNEDLLRLLTWIVGLLVSLAVGLGMMFGTLTIPYIQVVVPAAGWIIVVGTIIIVLAAVIKATK